LNSRSGLTMGDFLARPWPRRKAGLARTIERGKLVVSRRVGRGKNRPPGGSRKACLFSDLINDRKGPRDDLWGWSTWSG
jgi:hypothetical protein